MRCLSLPDLSVSNFGKEDRSVDWDALLNRNDEQKELPIGGSCRRIWI